MSDTDVDPIDVEVRGDVIVIDGIPFSRQFFATIADADPSRIYRISRRQHDGAVLFETVDPR